MAFVQNFRSTDLNAPSLTGQAGSVTDMFDQLLLSDGYGGSAALAVTSITRSGSTATVTLTDNNLWMQTGNVVTIAGANESDYNGSYTITRTSNTTFTYTVANTPSTPATGTITADWRLAVTGITRSGTTATVTLDVSNATLRDGDYVKIIGANESDYNVTAQITVINGTSFSYEVANSPSTPATGTIKYQKAGVEWTTPYTGTNKRAYRSADVTSNQFYFRVDDTGAVVTAREAFIRGYETMSDIDTGGQPFPTVAQLANGGVLNKSYSLDATARTWTVIADSKTVYTIFAIGGHVLTGGFGHFNSLKPADGYNSFVCMSATTGITGGSTGWLMGPFGSATAWGTVSAPYYNYLAIARSYNQSGGSIIGVISDGRTTWGSGQGNIMLGGGGVAGYPYPNGPNSGLSLTQLRVIDLTGSTYNHRGFFPGLYVHQHNTVPQNNYDKVSGVVGLTGRDLLAVYQLGAYNNQLVYSGILHFDTTGPWS